MATIQSVRLEMGVVSVGDTIAYSVAEGTLHTGKIEEILSVEDGEFDIRLEVYGLVNSKFVFCSTHDLIIQLGGSLS